MLYLTILIKHLEYRLSSLILHQILRNVKHSQLLVLSNRLKHLYQYLLIEVAELEFQFFQFLVVDKTIAYFPEHFHVAVDCVVARMQSLHVLVLRKAVEDGHEGLDLAVID